MARNHRNVAVVIGYNAENQQVAEDIVPIANYRVGGSILLNSPDVRRAKGLRFISVRVFDDQGHRTEDYRKYYALDGQESQPFHRGPNGSIIENPP